MKPSLNLDHSTRLGSLLIVFLIPLGVGCFAGDEDKSRWNDWTTLRLKVRSAPFFRGQVEFRIEDAKNTRRLLTRTHARFLGATVSRSESETTFDRATGRTRESRTFGKKRGRHYVFEPARYTVSKYKPSRRGERREDWEISVTNTFDAPAGENGPERLYDYYGMLFQLREADLHKPGDEVVLHVATSKGPQAFRIRVAERRTHERSFEDLTTGRKTRERLRELKLAVSPADPDSDEGFLNMQGETELWVEAESKTPIEIGGKVPKAGHIRLVLHQVG